MSKLRDPFPSRSLRGKYSVSRAGKRLAIDEIDTIIGVLHAAKQHHNETKHDQLWLIIEYNDTNGKSSPSSHYFECNLCEQ